MKRFIIVLATIFMTIGMASAQERPTADETRKVIDYYYHGKGNGVVPMDFYICGAIGQEEGPDKNECLEKVNPSQIQLGQELYLWMNFLVPLDDTADIILSFSRKAKVRRTASVKLKGATRYRTWKRIPTNKSGQWTLSILQELEDKDLELGSLQYMVSESNQ